MTPQSPKIRAADHLVDLLVAQGTTHIHGVPGESYLPVLDALHGREDEIRFVTFRQEGGAAMAADAHGKLTGRPGICMVTRGPGATNAASGLHVAFQDSTPMILFIGQVARNMTEREAFQEVDYRRMFGQMAKWVAEVDDANRLQEFVTRAYRTAVSGRPGPVVLSLPEDMLYDMIDPPVGPAKVSTPRYRPANSELDGLRDLLGDARNPLVLVGGGGWTSEGIAHLDRFATTQALPVAASFRSQGLINNDHAGYVGHFSVGGAPYLSDAMAEADLILAIGPRLGEMTTVGYTFLQTPVPRQKLAHVFPSGEELGRVFEPTAALVSDTESFCREAATWAPLAPERFQPWRDRLRADFLNFADPASVPGDTLAPLFAALREHAGPDAIVCNGAGNYAAWLHRFHRYLSPGSQLAPTSGSMGYGLPAAIGAAVTSPGREVYAVAGDGCFLMTCQEMATAQQYGLDLTVIVVNNARFGTIRAHQEREFPDRVSGTDLTNPDFCAFAQSFGAETARVETRAQFLDALTKAGSRNGLFLIEIMQDPNLIAPGRRLG